MPADYVTPEIWFPNLGFYFERVPQHVFAVGGFAVYWYALIIVVGIVLAALMGFWWAHKTGQNV